MFTSQDRVRRLKALLVLRDERWVNLAAGLDMSERNLRYVIEGKIPPTTFDQLAKRFDSAWDFVIGRTDTVTDPKVSK